tara:strand:+ start:936 stop:1178 length:243 start_codon:yes stop_codon:yes gene_type:complete
MARRKGQVKLSSYRPELVLFEKFVTYTPQRDLKLILHKIENPKDTLQKIGDNFGISRERVRQVLNKYEFDTSGEIYEKNK